MTQRLLGPNGEWVEVHEGKVTIGLTSTAIAQMGSIEKLRLPEVGLMLTKGEVAVIFESCKAAYDFESPFSGTVTSVNEHLLFSSLDPNGKDWLFTLEKVSSQEVSSFFDV